MRSSFDPALDGYEQLGHWHPKTGADSCQCAQRGFRLLNRHGITGENLGSLNAVLPLVYYLYNTPDFDFRGSSEFERVNAAAMHR